MDQTNDAKIYEYADRFINLANDIAKADRSGVVGAALRFAAARYCAYEASMRTDNLAEDKEEQLQSFAKDFTEMLRVNIADYINIKARRGYDSKI